MFSKEVERTSASECTVEAAWVNPSTDSAWHVSEKRESETSLPCHRLEIGARIRIAPMDRQFGGWNQIHFHPNLRIPLECTVGKGITVTLEALSRECVAVALSPNNDFVLGKTAVVHFGSSGNLFTVIRRRLPSGNNEAVDIQFPGRVCSNDRWISYWVCLTSGKVYVGVGPIPGQQCIGVLDDSLYHQLRSGVDAVRYVGLGNSALGRNARPLKVRNVVVTTVPDELATTLQGLPESLPLINVDTSNINNNKDDAETQKLMEEYQKECLKAKARAKKFGIPYKEPAPQAFFQWSQARRLRANPERGFITGVDVLSPEEREKQKARAERFGITKRERAADDDDNDEEKDPTEQHNDDGEKMEEEPLAVVQAWDNEGLVRPHRADPIPALWKNHTAKEEEETGAAAESTESDYVMESEPIVAVPEKIHICSIDWAAFKQIRTDDIMAYFAIYGPSYVEWLGELSCNVFFEDKFSASRAMYHLAQEIPSPPPPEVAPTQTTPPETQEQQQQQDQQDQQEQQEQQQEQEPEQQQQAPLDLGNMGWMFCRHPIRKVANDRFGRRGTKARLLMRVANSSDVLLQRPISRPAPPPGFTTKRVLGPGSDFDTKRRERPKKRRRRNPDNNNNNHNFAMDDAEQHWDGSGDHPALSRGLMSGRAGYSVEELEAERSHNVGGEEGQDTMSEAAVFEASTSEPQSTDA